MATEVKIPNLGESITSGILATWHVKSGDTVQAGQALFELETDKITSEGTAEVAGRIELKVEEGTEVEVGSIIAVIDETKTAEATSEEKESPEAKDSSEEKDPEEDKGEAKQKKAPHQHPASVRRLADESGIDPETVDGSGKDGRVTKGDMLKAIDKEKETKAPQRPEPKSEEPPSPESGEKSAPEGAPAPAAQRTTRKKMSPLRRTIANRLVQAQQSTAMLTTFNEADMTAVMNFRKTHQEAFVERHGIKLGFMSFFTKAVVQALRQVPGVNAQLDGEEIVQNHYYDLGIAVSTPKGLMVPVIRDCERKSFSEIEKDILGFASKAREGKITIEDIKGVFTITNGGIFGSMLSTPILNTPQSAILGMHTIQERPVAVNGEVVIRPMMYLALSYDHRIIDGREAVTFLVSIKKSIEDPSRLLFEL